MRAYKYGMPSNIKFHAIALSIICIVITALYFLIGPSTKPTPVDPRAHSDRAIEIYTATWGEDCNPYIQEEIIQRSNKPPVKNDKGEIVAQEPLKLVEQNNVLTLVGNACNGQLKCDINPTPATMGIDPLPSCAKKLNLSYRCYSYDRLWNVSIGQGVTTTIDCDETSAPTSQAPGTASEAAAPAGK